MGFVAALVACAVGSAVWAVSKQSLQDTPGDGHHIWVPLATFAAAGLTWGAVHRGAHRGLRAVLGAVVGAVSGATGEFLIGSADMRRGAYRDEILSSGTIGRAFVWALIGAAAWGATVAVATPRPLMARAAAGAALGGAAIGAAMGVLAGTLLGSQSNVLADAWFTVWYGFDGEFGHVFPVLVLSVAIPLLIAASAGAAPRRATVPLALAAAACLLLPGIAIAVGHGSDIDGFRQRSPQGQGTIPAESIPGSTGEESSSAGVATVPASEDGADSHTSPASTAPIEPLPPGTTPIDTTPIDTTPIDATPIDTTPATIAADLDPGFPVIIQQRFSVTNTVGEGLQGEMLVGSVYRNDAAPAAPDSGEICALGPDDAVIPFYLHITPYNASVSKVRVLFSQTILNVADAAAHPLTIQFNDAAGPRCAAATDPNLVATAAAVEWDTVGDGESAGTYGYVVVANYFDATGAAIGASSAVLADAFQLNHSGSTWSSNVYGTRTIPYDNGNGSFGAGFALVP